ncbi:MAG: PH domain-containing protein [Actinomycetia bacterium]|nr:PH domain-containing protein [Actinomycetes bacterium]
MGYDQDALNEWEEMVLDLHPHWWAIAPSATALVGSIIIGMVVLVKDWGDILNYLAGLLVLAALIWFGINYARWVTTNFAITTDRLIYRVGVFAKSGIEIPLERVNTVFFRQTIFERMLGAGDLTIESAGEQGRQDFSNVRRPQQVQNEVYKQMELNENRKFDRINAVSPASIPDQIEKLDELRNRGVITTEEFEAKKAELLGRM